MKCALDGADLRGARLTKAKLNLSNFQDAKMDGADLRGVEGDMQSGVVQTGGMQK